jgi:hypothetical protein
MPSTSIVPDPAPERIETDALLPAVLGELARRMVERLPLRESIAGPLAARFAGELCAAVAYERALQDYEDLCLGCKGVGSTHRPYCRLNGRRVYGTLAGMAAS